MPTSEPSGCLTAILSLFGIRLGGPSSATDDLPYRLRDDFLSPAEHSFYRVLAAALGGRAVVCCKVNLADLFFVARPNENQGARNRIDRKHVDFLLCDPATMKPRCGIELDDASHARRKRQDRDELVDAVFAAAGLPLVRIPAQAAYQPAALLALVEPHLLGTTVTQVGKSQAGMSDPLGVQRKGMSAPPTQTGMSAPPHLVSCPRCGVPMVERVAKQGPQAGQRFWGCPNYSRCRETVAIEG